MIADRILDHFLIVFTVVAISPKIEERLEFSELLCVKTLRNSAIDLLLNGGLPSFVNDKPRNIGAKVSFPP